MSLELRRQLVPPVVRVKPLAMQYDHLSRSMLMLVHAYPFTPKEERVPECPTGGVYTPKGHPALSFVAVNVTGKSKGTVGFPVGGGYVIETGCCGDYAEGEPYITGDDQVVTFCSPTNAN